MVSVMYQARINGYYFHIWYDQPNFYKTMDKVLDAWEKSGSYPIIMELKWEKNY